MNKIIDNLVYFSFLDVLVIYMASIVSLEELIETWWAIHSELEITKDSPEYLNEVLVVAFESTLSMCGWSVEKWNDECNAIKADQKMAQ